jgi:hypothetical protein
MARSTIGQGDITIGIVEVSCITDATTAVAIGAGTATAIVTGISTVAAAAAAIGAGTATAIVAGISIVAAAAVAAGGGVTQDRRFCSSKCRRWSSLIWFLRDDTNYGTRPHAVSNAHKLSDQGVILDP